MRNHNQPEPETIIQTVVVTEVVEKEGETVVETKIVEVEVQVTPTPEPEETEPPYGCHLTRVQGP